MHAKPQSQRNRLLWIVLIVLAAVLGIGSRRYGHALPWFVAAYAGDTLWATAAFLGLGLLRPRASTRILALSALTVSVLVELSQFYHAPWIDAVRRTTLGALAIGSGFVASDLVCYTVGVGLGVGLERGVFRLRRRTAHQWPRP